MIRTLEGMKVQISQRGWTRLDAVLVAISLGRCFGGVVVSIAIVILIGVMSGVAVTTRIHLIQNCAQDSPTGVRYDPASAHDRAPTGLLVFDHNDDPIDHAGENHRVGNQKHRWRIDDDVIELLTYCLK